MIYSLTNQTELWMGKIEHEKLPLPVPKGTVYTHICICFF